MFLVTYAFKRLQCLHLHFKDFNVFSHLHFQKTTMYSCTFQRLHCLQSFTLSKDYNVFIYIPKTSMSSVNYTFKRLQCLHLHFKDFNIFSQLRFQRLQCLHLNLQDFNVFCLLHLQDFNVFYLLHFTRLQCLLSFTLYKTSKSFFFYRTQCPCLCAS